MKRTLVITLVLALILALALPGVALARKGGVPAGGNGKGRAPAAVEAPDEVAEDGTEAPSRGKGNGADKDKGKPESAGSKGKGASAGDESGDGEQARDRARDRARTQEHSEDASGSPEPKRTGIANALSRLEANLARMQAQLEAGERTNLPPGLQRAIAKFMSWLGIAPDDGTVPDDGADSDDGSEEPTGTVEPTMTVEPTVTPEPEPEGGF